MVKMCLRAVLCLFFVCGAVALADEAPTEVEWYVGLEYKGYTIEDYIEFCDTPTVPYGFALLKAGVSRRLAIFTANPDGKMEFWTENKDAVPSSVTPARFVLHEKGKRLPDVVDGLRFTVETVEDKAAQESVTYQFGEAGFELVEYSQGSVRAVLRENGIEFREGEAAVFVNGLVDRDLMHVNYDRLPKTPQEARETLYAGEMPLELYRNVLWYFPEYRIEDYFVEIPADNEHVYRLVLLRKLEERLLAFYRFGGMGDGELVFAVKDALPKGEGNMRFLESQEGTVRLALESAKANGSVDAAIELKWRDDAFHLLWYMDHVYGEEIWVQDGRLVFADGSVPVTMMTDVRCVDFEALPKTYAQAKKEPDIPPAIPMAVHPAWNELRAEVKPMIAGRNHKVYMGPGERFPRSGNGKGTVSTNGWVQVFGEYNGWLMVQYHIDAGRYRIGWIKEPALQKGVYVRELSFFYEDTQEILTPCVLTDDPLGSGTAVIELEPGTTVRHLEFLGEDWEYVEATVDGVTYWGFVPSNCLSHG